MISPASIDKVLNTAIIEDVIGEFVKLKRSGSSWKGLSPFALEKSPSFFVVPAKGIFKDFSSGIGGNVISFLMEHEKMSYVEAIRWLANRYSIELEETHQFTSQEMKDEQNIKESIFIVNAFAAQSFHKNLEENEEGKAIGLAYFKERKVKPEMMERFSLGYSLAGRDLLYQELKSNGYLDEIIEKSVIAIKHDNGKFVDRFHSRVMFPIRNLSGKVAGFGGRVIKSTDNPKYLNTSENPVYNKSNILYGMFEAKKSILKENKCYLVEGYMDVVGMHQVGIENVVSSSGTSLTEQQAQLIKRFADAVVLIYDSDPAGIKAGERGIDILLTVGLQVKVILLPEGEDPDSFARKQSQNLKFYLDDNELDFIKFKLEILAKEGLSDPYKKANAIKSIANSISCIEDTIIRETYIKEAHTILKVDYELILQEVNRILLSQRVSKDDFPTSATILASPPSTAEEILISKNETKFQERDLIRLLVLYANEPLAEDETVVSFIMKEADDLEWEDEICHSVFELFKHDFENNLEYDERKLTQNSNPKISQFAIDIITADIVISANWEIKHGVVVLPPSSNLQEDVDSCIIRLVVKFLKKEIKLVEGKIQAETDEEKMDELLIEKRELLNQLKKFSKKGGTAVF